MHSNIASLCVADISDKVKAVVEVSEKTFYVYNTEVFNDVGQELQYPYVGVIYGGLKGNPDNAQGRGARLSVILVLSFGTIDNDSGGLEDKDAVTYILDEIRHCIIGTVNPSGKKWEFVAEIPFQSEDESTTISYMQRWETSVIVT